MRSWNALLVFVLAVAAAPVYAQPVGGSARVAPGYTCTAITQANADASAGVANVNHDGTPLAGSPPRHLAGFPVVSRAQPNPS